MSSVFGSAFLRKSITDVTRRKGRTLVVVLSIFIGVIGLTGVNVFSFKLTDAYAHVQDRSHYPDITFSVDHLDPALISQLVALPNVQAVQTYMTQKFQWQNSSGSIAMNIQAFPDPQHVSLGGFEIVRGHYPGRGEIALELSDLALHSFSLGDVIHVTGPRGSIALHIVAIVQTPGLPSVRGSKVAQGYMNMQALSQIIDNGRYVNSIGIKVRDINAVHTTAQLISSKMQQQHITMSDLMVQSSLGVQLGLDFVNGFFNVVRMLASGAIVVSCFLIINTLMTLVAEQMKVIGTMKAMGGTQGRILMSYLLTVSFYSIVGTFLGLALGITIGYVGAWQFAKLKLFDLGPFSIPSSIFLIGIGSGIVIPLLTAGLTLLDGTRITVRQALGAYGVASVSYSGALWQRAMGKVSEHLTWVPQTIWLGLRGIFRKRVRAIMTILALTLSGITFLAVMTYAYSINHMVSQLRENYTYDMVITSNTYPQGFHHTFPQLRQMIMRMPNVALVEPGMGVPIKTQWSVLDMEGLTIDTQVYHKPIIAGRWFAPGERNVLLLDEQTLRQAHLSIGDTLTFTDDTGHRFHWKIIGAVRDMPTVVGFGGVAITSIENVNALSGNPSESPGLLYIQAHDHSPSALKLLTNQIEQTLRGQEDISPIQTKQEQLDGDKFSAQSLLIVFYIAAAGVALVGILGLYNTLTSSVLERQREIGIWRSMGASNWQVSRVFWIEGLTLAGLAWLVGAIVSVPVAYGFVLLVGHWLFPVPFAFDPWSLAVMLLVLTLVATFACFGPTARAGRARIAQILRYE